MQGKIIEMEKQMKALKMKIEEVEREEKGRKWRKVRHMGDLENDSSNYNHNYNHNHQVAQTVLVVLQTWGPPTA